MYAPALLLILASSLPAANAATLTARFDNPDRLKSWSFHNGPEFPGANGSIEWNGSQGHDKPGCLAIHYSFAGGGNYVQATWNLPENNSARTLYAWLRKPGAHRVTFRAMDFGGQTFQKGIDYTYPGWQQLEVDLRRWDAHFGGPNDGQLRLPIRQIGILVENSTQPREGVLLVDDLELADRPTGRGSTESSAYTGQSMGPAQLLANPA